MKYKTCSDDTYRNLSILPSRTKREYKIESILNSLYAITNYMTDKHCKVMQTRFDLRYPNIECFDCSSSDMSLFMNEFVKAMNRMYCSGHYVDGKYLWVKEQLRSEYPHYHVVFFCNGNAIQSPYTVFKKAEYYWFKTIGYEQKGLVDYCLKNNGIRHENGIMIDRNKIDYQVQLNKAFRASSYLAKVQSKDIRDKYSCSFRSSQIPSEYFQ